MTTRIDLSSPPPGTHPARRRPLASRARARARTPGARWPSLCAAMLCAGSLVAGSAQARTAKPPRAASTPSTAQILAPSVATLPDPLPLDRTIYRCANSYSPHPCADATPLDVADTRSDAQRRQSEDLTARAKRMAAWLEAERHARDGAASEPKKARVASELRTCEETAAITCKPKKPRPRHAVGKAASGAARAGPN